MKYYVYELYNPLTNKIFYVGKGCGNRAEHHHRYIKSNDKSLKTKIVKKILKNGQIPIIKKVFHTECKEEADQKEIELIAFYGRIIDKTGPLTNIALGGNSLDTKICRIKAIYQHKNMTEDERKTRAKNCSLGQKKRYANTKDTTETKLKKSISHRKSYKIISPTGQEYITHDGLKEFALSYGNMLQLTYWQLFRAYRNNYENITVCKKRKDNNKWQVIKLDESYSSNSNEPLGGASQK
jgi:hypothetical protein